MIVLFVLGAGMIMMHQSMKTAALQEKKVEYRYLPLDLDTWLKEQSFSAFNVMNDMVNQTQGYCSVSTASTAPTAPFPTPIPTSTPVPFTR